MSNDADLDELNVHRPGVLVLGLPDVASVQQVRLPDGHLDDSLLGRRNAFSKDNVGFLNTKMQPLKV